MTKPTMYCVVEATKQPGNSQALQLSTQLPRMPRMMLVLGRARRKLLYSMVGAPTPLYTCLTMMDAPPLQCSTVPYIRPQLEHRQELRHSHQHTHERGQNNQSRTAECEPRSRGHFNIFRCEWGVGWQQLCLTANS